MKGLSLHKRNLRTLLAGIGVILLTNAFVLGGVAYNRSGTPEGSATLTERELALPYYYGARLYNLRKENSGISLRIHYRNKGSNYTPYYYYRQEADWLSKEKLAELGFDVSKTLEDKDWRDYKRQKEKEVILVLEYNGEAYQAALEAAQKKLAELEAKVPLTKEDQNKLKQAQNNLKQEQNSASRLFVIDAGLDQDALRKQYPDNTKYLLLKGRVGIHIIRDKNRTQVYKGYIKALSIRQVYLPHKYHKVLEAAMAVHKKRGQYPLPHYEVKLNIGKRLEPWVAGINKL